MRGLRCSYWSSWILCRKLWFFWWIEVRNCSCCDICAFFKLNGLYIFVSVLVVQLSWLLAALKSSQWGHCFHPWVIVKILRQKPFFYIVNTIFINIFLFIFWVSLLIEGELVFLALIIEFCFDMRLVMFVLITARRL